MNKGRVVWGTVRRLVELKKELIGDKLRESSGAKLWRTLSMRLRSVNCLGW